MTKPSKTNTSNATKEAMPTFRLDATGRPCRRQVCREGVVSHTVKLILHQQLSLQARQLLQHKRDERNHEARRLSQWETPGRLGIFTPLISYNASVGINKKAKTSSKNKCSCHDTWNTRHTRNTRSTNIAGKSTGSATRDTVPKQQDKRKR